MPRCLKTKPSPAGSVILWLDNVLLFGSMKTTPDPRIRSAGAAPVGAAAIDELTDLEAVARVVLGQRLARDLDRKLRLASVDYEAEKHLFFASLPRRLGGPLNNANVAISESPRVCR